VRTPDPIQPLKEQLARLLVKRLDRWSQEMAGELLGSDQPRMSDLRNKRLDRFSLDRLVRFVDRVGGDVSVQVVWARKNFIGPRDTSA
jgi:predicted XRE-type DNA-binding protein